MSKKLIASSILALGLLVSVNSASAATTVKYGMKGADVTALQTALKVTPTTGYYGKITLAAVKAFQTAHNLTADGVVGPMTWAAINASTVTTTPTTGTTTPTTGTTTPTTGTTLTGGAATVTLTSTSTDVESTVKEGASNTKVLGFKAQADSGDIAISNLKVTLINLDDSTSSKRLNRYASTVSVWAGSTKVGSASVSDFTKDGNEYSKSISLSDAVVKMGSANKVTFYVTVDANSSIDSTDMETAKWAIQVSDLRYTDPTGVVLTTSKTIGSLTTKAFDFTKLSKSGDVKVTVSKGSSSPVAQNVTVSDTSSTKDVLLLEFKVKATGTDVSFDTLKIATTLATASGEKYSDVVGELQLKKGSSVLATIDGSDLDTGVRTFDLDDTYTIDADSTDTFRVYATINDIDNFKSGDGLTVSFDEFSPEDTNGDVIKDTGSAVGSKQTFVYGVPTLAKVDSSLKVSTTTDGTGEGQEDLYTATMKFTVTAPDDNAVYVPLDTFGFGTAGTAGVQYTVTPGVTVVSANMQYSGSDSLSSIKETNTYRVDAGSSQQFTLSVVLKGSDTYGKVTMTGISYETDDTTPNNNPTATISDFYTSSVLLAK